MDNKPQQASGAGHHESSNYHFRPGVPMALSVIVPGLGQFYDGRRFAGCLWLFVTLVGYVPFIVPGILLHLLAILAAGFRRVEPTG